MVAKFDVLHAVKLINPFGNLWLELAARLLRAIADVNKNLLAQTNLT